MTGTCFSIIWLVHILVWLVILGAVIAILRILLPWLLSTLGIGAPIMQIINIIIATIVIIALLFFIVDLLSCARVLP